jgi:hypothetical protein
MGAVCHTASLTVANAMCAVHTADCHRYHVRDLYFTLIDNLEGIGYSLSRRCSRHSQQHTAHWRHADSSSTVCTSEAFTAAVFYIRSEVPAMVWGMFCAPSATHRRLMSARLHV